MVALGVVVILVAIRALRMHAAPCGVAYSVLGVLMGTRAWVGGQKMDKLSIFASRSAATSILDALPALFCAKNQQRESQPHDRNPGAEQPSPQPATGSVRAMLVSLGKFSSIFRGSRAYLFASDMVQAGKDGDVHLFAARVYAYDNVCRLDAWYLR